MSTSLSKTHKVLQIFIKGTFVKTSKPPPPMFSCEFSKIFKTAVCCKEHPETVASVWSLKGSSPNFTSNIK